MLVVCPRFHPRPSSSLGSFPLIAQILRGCTEGVLVIRRKGSVNVEVEEAVALADFVGCRRAPRSLRVACGTLNMEKARQGARSSLSLFSSGTVLNKTYAILAFRQANICGFDTVRMFTASPWLA